MCVFVECEIIQLPFFGLFVISKQVSFERNRFTIDKSLLMMFINASFVQEIGNSGLGVN